MSNLKKTALMASIAAAFVGTILTQSAQAQACFNTMPACPSAVSTFVEYPATCERTISRPVVLNTCEKVISRPVVLEQGCERVISRPVVLDTGCNTRIIERPAVMSAPLMPPIIVAPKEGHHLLRFSLF